ncbi:MAG: DUF1223 domain-containing protein [Yoonia sp.]
MRQITTALAFIATILAVPAIAQQNKTVVELFTSQGCSSCPPADAILYELAARDDVIALALHVDYWDYLGWKDNFGRTENSARQHRYAAAANATTVYTPQMVIAGKDHVIGTKTMEVMDRIADNQRQPQPVNIALSRANGQLQIAATSSAGRIGNLVVQVVRYTPSAIVAIKRGENAGRSLKYSNIVTAWDTIGRWNGARPLAMNAPISGDDPVVVIVQHDRHGPILAAAELR